MKQPVCQYEIPDGIRLLDTSKRIQRRVAGLPVGNFMWNISDIDDASLATIALGDVATCLSEQIRIKLSYYENSDYSVLGNDDIAIINNLAQLRIYGEDEFMVVMDDYPKLFNQIHKALV